MKASIFIVILAMTALMIPSGKAEQTITATPSENHHVPELLPGNSTGSQPYMAGWMDACGYLFGVTQTRITVSFPETDPSVIQTDNWLAGGMFVTGFDSILHQIDYGFYTMLTLRHDGNLDFDVGIYKTYEALPPWPYGLIPWAELLYSATWSLGGVSPSTPITLTARWDVLSGLVYWDFDVLGDAFPPFTIPPFNVTAVAPTIQRHFILGTVSLGLICIWALPYLLAYDSQFGILSNYNIGHGGWNVKLEYPQYYKDERWSNVDTAKSIGGVNAYLDATWRWGGQNYDGVNAYYYNNQPSLGRHKIIFYYSGSTLSDHTLLWAQNDAGKGVDAGNSFTSATIISPGTYTGALYQPHDADDWYQFYAGYGQSIYVTMTPPEGVDFDLELYNPGSVLKAGSYTWSGYTERVSYSSDWSGYWRIRVYISGGEGQYLFYVSVTTPDDGGGGTGGCPFVYAWNGTRYVVDNNLLGDSEASSGADVDDYYKLEQSLVQKNGKYELLIREFEHEHSYIDQVKLMAVDHDSDIRVAVTQRGEILTYKNPHQPISATDNYGNNRLDLVSTPDNNYYMAHPDEYLTLDFGNLDVTNGAKLVLRANVEKKPADPGACIYVQVLKEEGWFETDVLRTRQNWSTQIVDVRGHLPDANGELKIRLYFTGVHRIDCVGLDTTKQDDYQLQTANLVSAIHSVQGDVKPLLSEVDNAYAELVPGEQIQLSFTLPNNSKQTRTYIFYTEGHYYTITQ